MSSLLRSSLALLGLLCASALPALAQDCTDLKDKLSTRDGLDAYLKQETSRDVICAVALQSNEKTSSFCYAVFNYRSEQAIKAFESLNTTLSNCFKPVTTSGAGEVVNHPDSFDQLRFCAHPNDLSLSLKDKAALNQTLVFMRLDQRDPDAKTCS